LVKFRNEGVKREYESLFGYLKKTDENINSKLGTSIV
ncbi:MAG: hypothetical protein ACI9ES_003472, partial [Oceanospirillaceae bacterium]